MQKNKVKLFVGFLVILGLIGMPGKGFSQTASQTRQVICIQKADGTIKRHVSAGNGAALFALTKQGSCNFKWIESAGSIKTIVKFKALPLIKFRSQTSLARNNALTDIQSVHERFRKEILALENNLRTTKGLRALNSSQILKKTYKHVFNGAAVELSPENLEKVRQFSYVAAVYTDQEVHAVLNESVPLIGATRVWNELGLTGQGIKVAVIDTGIDYTHADFGANLSFPSAKVIGGYDCINNDNNPMDDHGHGTHVAGIVAANGALKGVAPDARLFAFKVLDAGGSGRFSTVIDGIERAVDPDGNPQTADGADVINLSLGGPGDADDPLSQAVDNAVDGGVLVVVAAGNDGPNYQTILSPGLARKALTVAAGDKSDRIASFSSRGPGNDFAIKPDITAPGVAILSCNMFGGSIAFNGTSMAAPHVAGAAALLLQGRPSLAPLEVKQILMGNAINIDQSAFTQGSGRLDIYKAVKSNTLVSPASLSLGLDDLNQAVWSKTETMTIKNLGNDPSAYTYSLTLANPMPAGITVSFPSQIELNSQDRSAHFDFTLTVDNNLVPNVVQKPYSYESALLISNHLDTFRLPFAFIKTPVLTLNFDQVPSYFTIHNRKDWYVDLFNFLPPKSSYNIALPTKDTYDIIALFGYSSQVVVKEDIFIDNSKVINISSSEAIHQMTFHPVDHNNNVLYGNLLWWLRNGVGFHVTGSNNIYAPLKFSNVSKSYNFDWAISDFTNDQSITHQISGQVLDGIHSNMVFGNTPEEYVPVEYTYHVAPNINRLFIVHNLSHIESNYVLSAFFFDEKTPPLLRNQNGEFKRTFYIRPIENRNWYYHLTNDDVYEWQGPVFDWINAKRLLYIPYFLIEKDQPLRGYLAFDWSNPVLSTHDRQIGTGLGPHYWSGRMQNPSNANEVQIYPALGGLNFFYLSPFGDFVPKTRLSYYLYDHKGQFIISNVFPYAGDSGFGPFYETIPLPSAGPYQLRIPYYNYYITGYTGQATTVLDFDTRQADPNPPYMQNFKILCGGSINNILTVNTTNEIRFNLLDDQTVGSVSLTVKAVSDSEWQVIPLTNILNQYSALIPNFNKSGFYSLMLKAQDNSGNSFTTTWDYAFYYHALNLKFVISGNVMHNGTGLANVIMNGLPGNPFTDENGFYNVTVDSPWSGTMTPTLLGYGFTPSSRDYVNVAADLPDQNFTATKNSNDPPFVISGNVMHNGTGLANVIMNGLPGNPFTDENGFHSVTVDSPWSGTVTPTLSGYGFTPSSRNYVNAAADLPDQNFTATKNSSDPSGSGGSGGGGGCFISILGQNALQPGSGKVGDFGRPAWVLMFLSVLCLMVSGHRWANRKSHRKQFKNPINSLLGMIVKLTHH